MKKSVAVVIVTILIIPLVFAADRNFYRAVGYGPYSVTGAQILDLPPPPAPPGVEGEQPAQETAPPAVIAPPPIVEPPPPTTKAAELLATAQQEVDSLTGRVEALEQKTSALNLLPEFESRLNRAETQGAAAATVVARLDSIQSVVDAMKVDVDNFRQLASRPVVEEPTFFGSISDLQGSIKRNAVLSLSLTILALLMVIGVIISGINQRKNAYIENKRMIQQYLSNYQKSGYKLDTLRMHLRACGWKDEFVEECVRDLG